MSNSGKGMWSIGDYLKKSLYGSFTLVLASGLGALALIMHYLDAREFDAALLTKAQTLSHLIYRHPQGVEIDFVDEYLPEFERPEHPDYFQVRINDGTVLKRSARLGTNDLPFAPGRPEAEVFRDLILPDGCRGRSVQIALSPRTDVRVLDEDDAVDLVPVPATVDTGRPYVVLSIAWSRSPLDRLLLSIYLIVLGMMVLLILVLMVLVNRFLRRGFRPIEQMNVQIRALKPLALDRRVELPAPPVELQPVLSALNAFLDELQNAFARERRFTGDVAHELRTPVAEFRLACEIGARWPEDSKLVQTRFEELRQSALNMERKVSSLLELSRLDRQAVSVVSAEIPLWEFAAARWDRLVAAGNPLRLRLDNRIPAGITVRSDEAKLDMVLDNLLRNALAYSRPETEVVIEGGAEPDAGFGLSIINSTDDLAAEDLECMFDRFWRKDQARTDGRSFGLGLSIVKALTEMLDIRLQVRLTPAGQFTVQLGFPPGAAAASQQRQDAIGPGMVSRR